MAHEQIPYVWDAVRKIYGEFQRFLGVFDAGLVAHV